MPSPRLASSPWIDKTSGSRRDRLSSLGGIPLSRLSRHTVTFPFPVKHVLRGADPYVHWNGHRVSIRSQKSRTSETTEACTLLANIGWLVESNGEASSDKVECSSNTSLPPFLSVSLFRTLPATDLAFSRAARRLILASTPPASHLLTRD